MLTALVDYDSGNLHSAEKAFQRMALEVGGGDILVTSRPEDVARADRIVLPGDGAFPACRAALGSYGGLFEAIEEAVIRKGRPFLGICVGMQVLFDGSTEPSAVPQPGIGEWPGQVRRLPAEVVPHMGWNTVTAPERSRQSRNTGPSPLLATRPAQSLANSSAWMPWLRPARMFSPTAPKTFRMSKAAAKGGE